MCRNIELFDAYTAKIFARLYERFPMPDDVSIIDFLGQGSLGEYGDIVDEHGKKLAEANIAWHTFIWLKETGFIRIEGEHAYLSLTGIVLTAKGLEVLKATPSSVQPSSRIGDVLIGMLKTGATESASQLIGQAIKLGTTGY